MDVFEQVGGGDVGHVERRVLAQQHHVHVGEVDDLGRRHGVVIAGLAAYGEGPGGGKDPPILAGPTALEGQLAR